MGGPGLGGVGCVAGGRGWGCGWGMGVGSSAIGGLPGNESGQGSRSTANQTGRSGDNETITAEPSKTGNGFPCLLFCLPPCLTSIAAA